MDDDASFFLAEHPNGSQDSTPTQETSFISHLYETVLERLLEVMLKLRGNQGERHSTSHTMNFILLTIYMSLNVLQLISLSTSCDLTAVEFEFWSVLRYVRLEWIAHKAASLWAFTVVAQSVCLTQFGLFVLAMCSVTSLSKLHRFAIWGLKVAYHRSFSVVIIPFQMALLTVIKYSFSSKTLIVEFEDLPVASLGVDPASCLLSILSFVTLLVLEMMKLITHTQISYSSYADDDFRFTAYFDILLRLGFSSLVGMYFFTDLMHPIVFRGITAAVAVYFAVVFKQALPYYLSRMNYMICGLCILLACASIAVLVGELLGNILTSFLLMVVVSPVLLPSSSNLISVRLTSALTAAPQLVLTTKQLQEFELCIRLLTRQATTPEALSVVMDHFINFRFRCKGASKMLDIYEAYFCIEGLHDDKLAMVKLARLMRPGFHFEAKFHERCLRKYLSSCKDLGQENQYLHFKTLFDRVKKLDEQVTLGSYRLWHEFSLVHPSSENIDSYMTFAYDKAKVVRQLYEDLIRQFPEAKDVYELFSSFVATVVSDDIASTMQGAIDKFKAYGRTLQRGLQFMKDDTGIMIVDTNPDNFAKILYANGSAAQIFGAPVHMLIGTDLNDYIPPPVNNGHASKMFRFASNCKSTNVELPFNVFVYNANKYLKDCRIIVRLTAVESHPVFVVFIVNLPSSREVAIVDDQGMIYAHSELLHQPLNLPQGRLEGRYFEDLLPIYFQDLELFKAYEVRKDDLVVKLALAKMSVHKVSLKLVFIFTDETEFLRWKLGEHKKDIDALTKDYQLDVEALLPTNLLDGQFVGLALASRAAHKAPEEGTAFSGDLALELPNASKFNTSNTSPQSEDLVRQQKLLGKFMVALKVSRIATLGSSVALVLISTTMLVYLTVSVGRIDQGFILKIFDDLTYNVLMSGFTSSILSLQHDGVVFYSFDKTKSLLDATSSSLRELLADMKDNEGVIKDYGFGELYDNDYVRSWHLINGDPQMRISNLVEVVENLIYSAAAGATLTLEECATTNKDLYYTYRNGYGEVFDTLNSTSYQYILRQRDFIDGLELNLLLMFGISGAVLLLCFALVIPSLVYLQRAYDNFWGKLATLKAQRALDLKFNVVRRVNAFFDTDVIEDLESSYSTDVRKIRSGDDHMPLLKIVIWRGIVIKLSIFVVLSAVLFTVFHQVCFVNIQDTLELYSERVYLSSQAKVGALSLIVWTEENNDRDVVIDSDVPSYYFAESSLRFSDSLDKFHTLMYQLYDAKYNKVEFSKKSLLREDFGSTTPIFHFGVRSAMVNIYQMFSSFQDKTIKISDEDLEQLIDIGLELAALEDEIVTSLFDGSKAAVDNRINQAITITVCYAMSVLVLSFKVYKHMFDSIATKIRRNLSVVKLVL
jgi:PAS domain-containing protein